MTRTIGQPALSEPGLEFPRTDRIGEQVAGPARRAVYFESGGGHSGTGMVEAVSSHLGALRPRGEAVEFRVKPFAGILGERLQALRFGTAGGTAKVEHRSESATAYPT